MGALNRGWLVEDGSEEDEDEVESETGGRDGLGVMVTAIVGLIER